jgi:hypothetical protein
MNSPKTEQKNSESNRIPPNKNSESSICRGGPKNVAFTHADTSASRIISTNTFCCSYIKLKTDSDAEVGSEDDDNMYVEYNNSEILAEECASRQIGT